VALDERVTPPVTEGLEGLEVLELGCGTGRHTARLVSAGAQVTAVDFSEEMMRRAREKIVSRSAAFVQHDLTRPLPFADASFDRVFSFLVFEHLHDLPAVFQEVARVCRPGGQVAITDLHPVMRLRDQQAHFHDPAGGQVWMQSATHNISSYLQAAMTAGLELTRIEEHAADAALVEAAPKAAKYLGWPLLLLAGWARR
jgi:malonyl-CoA O-methyltransferase